MGLITTETKSVIRRLAFSAAQPPETGLQGPSEMELPCSFQVGEPVGIQEGLCILIYKMVCRLPVCFVPGSFTSCRFCPTLPCLNPSV